MFVQQSAISVNRAISIDVLDVINNVFFVVCFLFFLSFVVDVELEQCFCERYKDSAPSSNQGEKKELCLASSHCPFILLRLDPGTISQGYQPI